MNKVVGVSPHLNKKSNTIRGIMLDVIVALCPCIIAATIFFGYHVIINIVVCVITCFATEMLYGMVAEKKFSLENVKKSTAWNLSCVVTGILLALNLPSKAIITAWDFNIYQQGFSIESMRAIDHIVISFDVILMGIIGSIFAIALVKMLFGGLGKNFANPAITARIFLVAAFGIGIVNTIGAFSMPASTGATWLSTSAKITRNQSIFANMFLGNVGTAAVGETSVIAILIGFAYLSIKKVIDFRIPIIMVASAALFAFLLDGLLVRQLSGARLLNNMFAHILSGGLIFGAVFMATDYSSSPNTFLGNVIFVCGIGLFTVLIRVFTPLPEGVSYSILLMNLTSPLIDKYIVPKPFGFVKPSKIKPTIVQPNAPQVDKKPIQTEVKA